MASTRRSREIQKKLEHLREQKKQLEAGVLPAYVEATAKMEEAYDERMQDIEVWRNYMIRCSERRMEQEIAEIRKESEENIKKLSGTSGCNDSGTGISTRAKGKLHRKCNNSVLAEDKKRKKVPPIAVVTQLTRKEIQEDLAAIRAGLEKKLIFESKIEDGKLFYNGKWFVRNQLIYVEIQNEGKFGTNITSIGRNLIWVKKPDGRKFKITMSQLVEGKVSIEERATP